jgi:hypothetical protein
MDYGAQGQGGGVNWLAKLREMVSPTSTAGMMGNQDLYNQHIQQSLEAGTQPMQRADFLNMLRNNPQIIQQIMGRGQGQGQGGM